MKKRDNAYKFANEFMKFMANSYEKRSDYTSIGYKQSMTMFLDYAEKVKKVNIRSLGNNNDIADFTVVFSKLT